MNSGSSASIGSQEHSSGCASTSSEYQRSRWYIGTGAPVRLTTSTCWTVSVPAAESAWSTLALSGTFLPPRVPSSAVMTTVEAQSAMRPASESGEKPPNTTEWIAPMRAHASIATAASGIIGR